MTFDDRDDEKWMRLALEEANQAAVRGEVPIGAVIVLGDGRLAARDGNSVIERRDPTAHAEILVIRSAALSIQNYRVEDATLFVTLEPCPMCAGAIVQARLGRVVFGAFDPKAGACGSLYNVIEDPRLNHRTSVSRGVLAPLCGSLLQEFFKLRR